MIINFREFDGVKDIIKVKYMWDIQDPYIYEVVYTSSGNNIEQYLGNDFEVVYSKFLYGFKKHLTNLDLNLIPHSKERFEWLSIGLVCCSIEATFTDEEFERFIQVMKRIKER